MTLCDKYDVEFGSRRNTCALFLLFRVVPSSPKLYIQKLNSIVVIVIVSMSTTTKATTTKTTTRTKLSWHRSNRIYRGRYNRSKSTFCPSFVIKREKNHQHHHHIHSHYHGHHIGCYEIESALCSALSCTRNSNNNNNNDNDYDEHYRVVKTRRKVVISALMSSSMLNFLFNTNSDRMFYWRRGGGEAFAMIEQSESTTTLSNKVKNEYDGYAANYDDLDGNEFVTAKLGIDGLRQKMFQRVEGDVLELAVGTGLNLPYYQMNNNIKSLTAIDLSPGMLQKAEEKWAKMYNNNNNNSNNIKAKFEIANVQRLPYEDETFDYVVDTFSMCVFEKPELALSEAKRVLKPGGRLILFEHAKSKDNVLLAKYQEATSGMVKKMAKGCDWSQDVEKLVIVEAGFAGITWGPFSEAGGLIEALEVQK